MGSLSFSSEELIQRLNGQDEYSLAHQFGSSISGYIDAAVLVPFVLVNEEWHLLYTRRTNSVSDHKGQVSFPGGAREEQDQNPIDTALRETYEEIGISADKVTPFSALSSMQTITHYYITPVLAFMKWPVDLRLEESEVERVFTVPIKWLSDPNNSDERLYEGPGGIRRNVIFYKTYDGETIWGITAAITQSLIKKIG